MHRSLVLGLVLWPTIAGAQDPAASRTLGRHRFVPSQIVTDPFTDTWFASVFAVGLVNGTGPTYGLEMTDGEYTVVQTGQVDLGLVGLDQHFSFQVGVLPWLAIHAKAGGNLLAASNRPTGLAVGVLVGYDAAVGASFSWVVHPNIRVGGVFDIELRHSLSLDFLSVIADSIEARDIDTSNLVAESDTTLFHPTVTAAFGLNDAVGVVLALRYSKSTVDTQRLVQRGDTGLIAPGVTFSLDLEPNLALPFSAGASYEPNIALDNGNVWHKFTAGLYYSGPRELFLGAELFFERVNFDPDITISNKSLQTVLRYSWK